jgi:hypothetical protein
MPILLMALLALLVFGLVGILLTVAMASEHSKRTPSAKRTATVSGAGGPIAPFHPKV